MPEINRRDFLFVTLAGSSLEAQRRPEKNTQQSFKTGRLAGRYFNDLYSYYTGIHGKVPERAPINYQEQLKMLWSKKNARSGNNGVVVKTGHELIKEYSKGPVRVGLKEYINEVDVVINSVGHELDWSYYSKLKGLNEHEEKLAKKLVNSINGRDLIAYSLTELMPSSDGELNKQVMEFLLKTAGRNYVESIPAIYDPKTSFGPYQFTEYALYESKGNRRGASIPNSALKHGKIVDSVAALRGQDHHKAAFLFVVDNLANLVNRLSEKQLRVLSGLISSRHVDLVAYTATAHHGPGVALGNARRWLDNGARLPYKNSCGKIYRLYAEKTEHNLRALN